MKMLKSVISIKKSLKINMLKIKDLVNLRTNVIMQVRLVVLHIAYII